MGERVDLQTTKAGQSGFNDWIGQQDNAATPKGVIPTILPTQEMRNFQRRYRFDSAAPTLAIGERWGVTWVIPNEQWWRILAIQFVNSDSVAHIISVAAVIDPSDPIQSFRASRFIVDAGIRTLIYGLDSAPIASNEYFGRFPSLLQPRDILSVSDQTIATAANQPQVTLVYELVPRPAEPTARGLVGTVDIT